MLKVLDNPSGPEESAATAPFLATAVPAEFASGFYDLEHDDQEIFRWMGLEGSLRLTPQDAAGFLELRVFSEFFDLSQELELSDPKSSHSFRLIHGWQSVSIPVPAASDTLRLKVNRTFPKSFYPADPRQLTVRISTPCFHLDEQRHQAIVQQEQNSVLNTREMIDGKTEMESTPAALGIDMYGVCNVKPPCVYCDWDFAKDLEQENVDAPFNVDTLGEYGEFFSNASSLINCSIGEPFMMKGFDELLDAFGNNGKEVEITTNGQILTAKNIDKLLGRKIELYISLDAATPETYATLRNDTFDRILANLRRLIAAKGGRSGLPRVHLVFMPMKCNVHELGDFVRLCAELEVDRLVLRPLNYMEDSNLDWEREGYHFVYNEELLEFEDLVRASGRAAALCQQLGVPLSDQLDFGGEMEDLFQQEFEKARAEESPAGERGPAEPPAASPTATQPSPPPQGKGTAIDAAPTASRELAVAAALDDPLGEGRLPACLEPWKSLYILRRGVMPCCYGHGPIADMGDYRETWNSKVMQKIRSELLGGRFHQYCLDSPACPILRKSDHVEDSRLVRPRRRYLRRALLLTLHGLSVSLNGVKRTLKLPDRIFFGSRGIQLYRRLRNKPASKRRSGSPRH